MASIASQNGCGRVWSAHEPKTMRPIEAVCGGNGATFGGPGNRLAHAASDRHKPHKAMTRPRRIKVPDRVHGAASAKTRAKADAGNEAHLGAPMPGVVSGVSVSAGQAVRAGDVLLSIEAMKMETALHAEKDGTISEVLVRAGDQIDAKDLLIVYGG